MANVIAALRPVDYIADEFLGTAGDVYMDNAEPNHAAHLDCAFGYIHTTNKKEYTMIPETLQKIMKQDGIVAIATLGPDGPHMVNTWNSYLKISEDGRLLIPAGFMNQTEANIAHNPDVLITLGSSKVEGLHGMGAGFLIKGKAKFVKAGPDFDLMKEKFGGLRATMAVTIETATQTW